AAVEGVGVAELGDDRRAPDDVGREEDAAQVGLAALDPAVAGADDLDVRAADPVVTPAQVDTDAADVAALLDFDREIGAQHEPARDELARAGDDQVGTVLGEGQLDAGLDAGELDRAGDRYLRRVQRRDAVQPDAADVVEGLLEQVEPHQ